jgi:hypothetical protein
MGRSVSTPSEARVVCYRDVIDLDEWGFDDLKEAVQESCKSQWPSFADCDKWIENEDHALVENDLCYVGISEYCGCAAIWISSKKEDLLNSGYSDDTSRANLCDPFIDRIEKKFREFFGELVKVGTGSNGIAFYEKAS